MSGGIGHAVQLIFERIPKPILIRTFMPETYGTYYREVNIEDRIADLVIRKQVIRDCSLRAGQAMTLPVAPNWIVRYEDPPRTIIKVPMQARQNLPMVSVLSVGYSNIGTAYSGYLPPNGLIPVGGSQMQNYAMKAMDSASAIMSLTSTSVSITPDGGSIIVLDAPRITQALQAEVILGYDDQISSLSPRNYDLFGKICLAATKMYIFNNLVVDMDRGEISGGADLGRFTEMVNKFESAEEEYDRLLNEEWYAAEMYSNPITKQQYIQSMIGPGR